MQAYQKGDYETAVRGFLPLAKQGDLAAQYQMGLIYNNGDGVSQSYREASAWFRRAAEGGHGGARIALGQLFLHGRGVPEDKVMAYVWLDLAVAQGDDELGLGEKGRRQALAQMTPQQQTRAQALAQEYRQRYDRSDYPEITPSVTQQTPSEIQPPGGYRVQLGSFRSEAQARAEWERLQQRYPDVVGALQHHIERADIGSGRIFHRLQAGPLDQTTAMAVCRRLTRQYRENCLTVKR
jgi:hypothetical protein